jgi:hypothetical protein
MLVSPRVEVADEVATRVGAPHDVGLTDADLTADHAGSSTLEPLLNLLVLGTLDLSCREAASTVQDRIAYLVKPADRRVRRQRLQVDGPELSPRLLLLGPAGHVVLDSARHGPQLLGAEQLAQDTTLASASWAARCAGVWP